MPTLDPDVEIYLLGTDKSIYRLAEKPFDPLAPLTGGACLDDILAQKVAGHSGRVIEPAHLAEIKGPNLYLGDVIEQALTIAREHNGRVVLIQRLVGGFPLFDGAPVNNYPLLHESLKIGVFRETPQLPQPYAGLP